MKAWAFFLLENVASWTNQLAELGVKLVVFSASTASDLLA